jgi:hypothetical protein
VSVYLNDGDTHSDFKVRGNFRAKNFSITQKMRGGGEREIARVQKESRFASASAFLMASLTNADKYLLHIGEPTSPSSAASSSTNQITRPPTNQPNQSQPTATYRARRGRGLCRGAGAAVRRAVQRRGVAHTYCLVDACSLLLARPLLLLDRSRQTATTNNGRLPSQNMMTTLE